MWRDGCWATLLASVAEASPTFSLSLSTRVWTALRCTCKRLNKILLDPAMRGLMSHQLVHFREMRRGLDRYHRMVDTSSMGHGKTYVACALARALNVHLTVFAPPTTVGNWERAVRHFDIPAPRFNFHSYTEFMCKKKPYLEETASPATHEQRQLDMCPNWVWKGRALQGSLLVLDESHWLKNHSSRSTMITILTHYLLENPRGYLMCLSATPFDKKMHAYRLCRVMNIVKEARIAQTNPQTGRMMYRGLEELMVFCHKLYKNPWDMPLIERHAGKEGALAMAYEYVTKCIKPHMFRSMPKPYENQQHVTSNYFACMSGVHLEEVMKGLGKLERGFAQMEQSGGMTQGAVADALSHISAGLRLLEIGKVPIFVRQTREFLDANAQCKVIIMLNYTDPLKQIAAQLEAYDPTVINGETDKKKRLQLMEQFQEPNTHRRLLICNLSVLAQGVDLDDRDGRFPRRLLISPSYHVINLHQATGRVLRTHTKSIPIVRFMYVRDAKREMQILHSLAIKSRVLGSALDYDVTFPGDHPSRFEAIH